MNQAYWVSPKGSDSGTGGKSLPFRTIQHALEVAKPGDTVFVLPGRYESIEIHTSGLPGAHITIRDTGDSLVFTPAPPST